MNTFLQSNIFEVYFLSCIFMFLVHGLTMIARINNLKDFTRGDILLFIIYPTTAIITGFVILFIILTDLFTKTKIFIFLNKSMMKNK